MSSTTPSTTPSTMSSTTLPSTNATRTIPLLLAALTTAALLTGCASTEPPMGNWSRIDRPVLQAECEATDPDDHLTGAATAQSLQLDLARRKAVERARADLLAQIESSVQTYFGENREEQLSDAFEGAQGGQIADSVATEITRAAGASIGGARPVRCDLFRRGTGDSTFYMADYQLGVPVGELGAEWAERVRRNPSLSGVLDRSETEALIRRWAQWALTRGTGPSRQAPESE